MNNNLSSTCPLCHSLSCQHYCQDKRREYLQCQHCSLVFVPQSHHLSEQEEKAEYDKHNNSQLDEGYCRFLNRTLEPLLAELQLRFLASVAGLDFGCGEGALLSQMAKAHGIRVENYDLYYHPDESVLSKQYDFIVMTEVLEHLARPASVIEQLLKLLKPGGIVAIMTKRVRNQQAFTTWHYKNDPTHIGFYSEATFGFMAKHYGLSLKVVSNDVVFFYTQDSDDG